MFVSDETIRIVHPEDATKKEDKQRFVTVRKKMNQGQQAAFSDEVAAVTEAIGACSMAHWDLLMFAHNVTAWGGPGLDGAKLTPENINRIDAYDPLFRAAVNALKNNNEPKASPDPKSESGDFPTEASSPEVGTTGSSTDGVKS